MKRLIVLASLLLPLTSFAGDAPKASKVEVFEAHTTGLETGYTIYCVSADKTYTASSSLLLKPLDVVKKEAERLYNSNCETNPVFTIPPEKK